MHVVLVVLVAGASNTIAQPHRPSWEVEREAREFATDPQVACASLLTQLEEAKRRLDRATGDSYDQKKTRVEQLTQEVAACEESTVKRAEERKALAATRPLKEIDGIPKRYRLAKEQERLERGTSKTPSVPTRVPTNETPQPKKPDSMKYPVGIYAGEVSRTDKLKGDMKGCQWVADRRLTLKVADTGDVTWSGYSYENIECPGRNSVPASCWYDGTGAFQYDKGWTLQARTTGIIPGPVEGSGRRVWKCGRTKVVLDDSVTPPKSCVALGVEDDTRALAVANIVCKQGGNLWDDLVSAKVTIKGTTMSIPVMGSSRLVLTRVATP